MYAFYIYQTPFVPQIILLYSLGNHCDLNFHIYEIIHPQNHYSLKFSSPKNLSHGQEPTRNKCQILDGHSFCGK